MSNRSPPKRRASSPPRKPKAASPKKRTATSPAKLKGGSPKRSGSAAATPAATVGSNLPAWWTPAPRASGVLSEAPPPATKDRIPHRIATTYAAIQPLVMNYIQKVVAKDSCIIFDIDATVLYNDERLKKTGGARINMDIKPLYDMAIQRKILVYFVTARGFSTENQEETMEQLSVLGYGKYEDLIMLPDGIDTWPDISKFKANARQLCMQKSGGRKCVLCVGDQVTDHKHIKSERLLDALDKTNKKLYWFIKSLDENIDYCVKLNGTKP